MIKKENIEVIDLFCGVGGLSKGLMNEGLLIKTGLDADPACRYPFEKNIKANFINDKIENIPSKKLKKSYSKKSIKVLAGCAPCQTFSTYNQKAKSTDERWKLLNEFGRLVEELNPDIITMENVPGLIKTKVYFDFIKLLKRNNYFVSDANIVDCSEYGIPQKRKRLVLLASKYGPINLLPPNKFKGGKKTVREAIGNLNPIKHGEQDNTDKLHISAPLDEINYKRIKISTPNGTWREWPNELRANCHKRKSGKTFPSVYGRMSWDEPSPTITTQFFGFGNGRFGHPQQHRAISLREGAILQSFPRRYKFLPPNSEIQKTVLGRLIGNAVPVRLGMVIGRTIKEHLAGDKV
ncbi:DNA cytosine methyltransferase [Leptospira alexanderi]|uniref:DNA cytosine methyltransferase n=1 Tax=Leptospira alexanderi TaxID=100053 RepID=UPI000991151B|nr:DNA cytosine methyltransferase [Leptospira alexanderi]